MCAKLSAWFRTGSFQAIGMLGAFRYGRRPHCDAAGHAKRSDAGGDEPGMHRALAWPQRLWQSELGFRLMSDLPPEQIRALRAMTPAQRLRVSDQLRATAWRLKAAGFRMAHPGWPEDRVQEETRKLFLYGRT